MNWHNTLEIIYSKLQSSGYPDISTDILEQQLSGATGGEVFGAVVSKLISIRRDQPEVYEIIKSEIDSFIEYGRSIGYLR